MSFEALAVEDLYAERGAPERPTFSPRTPPCDGCEHAARCGKERLACCEYATYAGSLIGHETLRRTPSAAWYAFVETEGPPPKCECKHARPINRKIRAVALQFLKSAPGSSVLEVADAAGVSRKSAKKALQRLNDKGLAAVGEYATEGGKRVALWRLT